MRPFLCRTWLPPINAHTGTSHPRGAPISPTAARRAFFSARGARAGDRRRPQATAGDRRRSQATAGERARAQRKGDPSRLHGHKTPRLISATWDFASERGTAEMGGGEWREKAANRSDRGITGAMATLHFTPPGGAAPTQSKDAARRGEWCCACCGAAKQAARVHTRRSPVAPCELRWEYPPRFVRLSTAISRRALATTSYAGSARAITLRENSPPMTPTGNRRLLLCRR